MKVAFLSTERSSTNKSYHERLHKLAAGLNSLGIQTDFIYFRDMYPGKPALLQPISCVMNFKAIQQCDIIHGGDTLGTYVGWPYKLLLKKPIVHDMHGDAFQDECLFLREQPWNPWRMFHVIQAGFAELTASCISDYYICVSEFQIKRLLSKGIPSAKMELIRNGVDTSLFYPISKDSNFYFTFCYAGAMQEYQDIEILLRAFHKLEINNVRLKIIGFTNKKERLKMQFKSLIKKGVELLDRLPKKELIKHLALADVLIIPRKNHVCMRYGFPMKFAEYAAMGKPIIVSDVDETSILIKKHGCGFVYEASNYKSLLVKLREAIIMSKQSFLEMGKNARRLAIEEFEWKKIARKYAIFLKRILQNHKEF